jgi:hypothetical protein
VIQGDAGCRVFSPDGAQDQHGDDRVEESKQAMQEDDDGSEEQQLSEDEEEQLRNENEEQLLDTFAGGNLHPPGNNYRQIIALDDALDDDSDSTDEDDDNNDNTNAAGRSITTVEFPPGKVHFTVALNSDNRVEIYELDKECSLRNIIKTGDIIVSIDQYVLRGCTMENVVKVFVETRFVHRMVRISRAVDETAQL